VPYRFATEQRDYSDYASGRVFYGLPGLPALPVRLASEMFARALALRAAQGLASPCTVFDPCCGGAYHLATLAYLRWHDIGAIIGSDIDSEALSLARRNLDLLTPAGIGRRAGEIAQMLAAYGKQSHAEALASAEVLRAQLMGFLQEHPISGALFRADATDGPALQAGLRGRQVDIVLTDVPYGRRSDWQVAATEPAASLPPVGRMLEALLSVVTPATVVAIAADKKQALAHPAYRRLGRLQIGDRHIAWLTPQNL
jgi:23S rRNA (guanine2535-N1)-methyltransferase